MSTPAVARARVFIDGEAGTTGLQIRERLALLSDTIDVVSIDPKLRKDTATRRDIMQAVDAVVLCLPDDAARDAVELADQLGASSPKIVDASTAHRVAPDWVYGFAELHSLQTEAIRSATRVANPGCYPTGAIALLRPLIDAGMIDRNAPITINAVSGFSGGGRQMIESYENGTAPSFELYALGLTHKHLPEIMAYAGLHRTPIFVPSVGNFRQGMLVSIPLHLDQLSGQPTIADFETTLSAYYASAQTVRVVPGAATALARIEPEALNDTDMLELFVFGNEVAGQAVLVARLDNLGKGAAGAAVQNLRLMLGLT